MRTPIAAALTFALAAATASPVLAANAAAAGLPCEKDASDCYCFANASTQRVYWKHDLWSSPEVSTGGTDCVKMTASYGNLEIYDKVTESFLSVATAGKDGGCVVVRGKAQIETKTGLTKKQCAQLIKKQP